MCNPCKGSERKQLVDRPTYSETDRRTTANKYDPFPLLQTGHKILETNANRTEFILHFNSKKVKLNVP